MLIDSSPCFFPNSYVKGSNDYCISIDILLATLKYVNWGSGYKWIDQNKYIQEMKLSSNMYFPHHVIYIY